MKVPRPVRSALACAVVGTALLLGIARIADLHAGEELPPQPSSPGLISRGSYLAKLADCAGCHTTPGKPAFAGGLAMAVPGGTLYSSNITPDPEFGIGRYSLASFDRALRYGVADGHSLYPAMPYVSYSGMTPDDVQALYAYFRHGVAPVRIRNNTNAIWFAPAIRWPLACWRLALAPRPTPFRAAKAHDAESELYVRGAYLVETLGHCGECHTPRNALMQLRARSPLDGSLFLAGAKVGPFYAPSLRNGGAETLGAWTEADIADYLRTGSNRHATASGSMAEVIEASTQYLTPADAAAFARYLKTLTAPDGPAGHRYQPDERTRQSLAQGDVRARGAELYLNNCAACHRSDGRGYDGVFPPLAGNPVILADDPGSLVAFVLNGGKTPRTAARRAQYAMPAFAWRLSDQDVADILSFIRTSWGNHAAPIDRKMVRRAQATATASIVQ